MLCLNLLGRRTFFDWRGQRVHKIDGEIEQIIQLITIQGRERLDLTWRPPLIRRVASELHMFSIRSFRPHGTMIAATYKRKNCVYAYVQTFNTHCKINTPLESNCYFFFQTNPVVPAAYICIIRQVAYPASEQHTYVKYTETGTFGKRLTKSMAWF